MQIRVKTVYASRIPWVRWRALKICQLLASFYIPKVDWLGAVIVLRRNFAGFLSRGTASSKME